MSIFKSSGNTFKSPNILKTVWKPSNIPNMVFWGDSTERNIIMNNNSKIRLWKDKSGNLNNAIQIDNNHQPLFIKNVNNFNNGLYFDLTDNLILRLNLNVFSIFSIVKINNDNCLYEYGEDVTTETGFRIVGTDTNSISVSKNGFSGIATSKNTDDSTWLSNNNLQMIYHSYNGTHNSHLLYINNSYKSTTNSYSDNPGLLNSDKELYIGSRYDYSLGIQGYIFEFLVYDRVLTISEKNLVTNYLNSKYLIF